MPEPNQVGEYLEGEMDPAQLMAFEQLWLRSDAVLAEVAACHQVLASLLRLEIMPDDAQHARLGVHIKTLLKQQSRERTVMPPHDMPAK